MDTRTRRILILLFAGVLMGALDISIYFPSLAKAAFNVSESTASFMMIPLVFSLFVSAPLAGKIIDRAGSRLVILSGLLILFSGLMLMSVLPIHFTVFYIAGILTGIGLAFLLGAPLRYIMNNETRQSDRAAGQSLLTIFTSTGQLFSAALTGALVAGKGGGIPGYNFAFLILALMILLLVIPAAGLKSRRKEIGHEKLPW